MKAIQITAFNIDKNTFKNYNSIFEFRKENNIKYKFKTEQLNKLRSGKLFFINVFIITRTDKFNLCKILKFSEKQLLIKLDNCIKRLKVSNNEIYILNNDLTIKSIFKGKLIDFADKYNINLNTAKAFVRRFPEKVKNYKIKFRFNHERLLYCYSDDYIKYVKN